MDCDKDKAIRAKEVAENMFNAGDIVGAMRYALKARSLFPSLEGIVEMVVTFSVYISAMTKIKGETAWYRVLKVDPMADDDTLRKQYTKLSFMLHPDNKNKSIGADGAFSLVSQAWSVLSDKAKRVAYDEKIKGLVCSLSTECVYPPEQTEANFSYKITQTAAAAPAVANNQKRTDAENSFWTVCNHCTSCYHYSRAYVNRRLVCHVCHKLFFAVEIDRPVRNIYRFVTRRKFMKTRRDISQKSLADSDLNWSQAMNAEQNFIANRKFSCSPLLRTSGTFSADRAANVVIKITEKLKRRRKEEEEEELEQKWKQKWEEASLGDLHVSKKGYFSPVKVSKALENLSLSSYNGEAPEILLPSNTGEKFIKMCSFRAELQNRRVEMDIEEISRKLEELHHDNEAGEQEYLKCEDTCDESNIENLEDRLSGSQATKPFASTDMAAMVAENFGKMSIDFSDSVIVKEADNDEKKEDNVEELINDIRILGEEGNDG